MKRQTLIFLIFLFLAGNIILLSSPCVKSGVKVSPAELIITIDDYPKKEIQYKIKVTNPFAWDIRVYSKAIHPYGKKENYTTIPDLSWIKILPVTLNIPANSYKEFEVFINIPEDKKMLHYNENWEVWVVVTPRLTSFSGGGALIQLQLAVRLLIHTPTDTMISWTPLAPYILYPILGIIISLMILSAVFLYVKKKRNIKDDKSAIFFVKKKKESSVEKEKLESKKNNLFPPHYKF
ncbi:MAG: hypothetical protein JSW06_11380 [Thermoplasmatales archaeon]|nr:MAG: hypothetical protein JSW06_11380 [Thermoplasmatales archaeon]